MSDKVFAGTTTKAESNVPHALFCLEVDCLAHLTLVLRICHLWSMLKIITESPIVFSMEQLLIEIAWLQEQKKISSLCHFSENEVILNFLSVCTFNSNNRLMVWCHFGVLIKEHLKFMTLVSFLPLIDGVRPQNHLGVFLKV